MFGALSFVLKGAHRALGHWPFSFLGLHVVINVSYHSFVASSFAFATSLFTCFFFYNMAGAKRNGATTFLSLYANGSTLFIKKI